MRKNWALYSGGIAYVTSQRLRRSVAEFWAFFGTNCRRDVARAWRFAGAVYVERVELVDDLFVHLLVEF